ncbi:MAG: SLOG cluster 4 domain-containing protein [Thermoanaerobaculia bacterium]
MARRIVIGIVGAGENVASADRENAESLGAAIAREGWVLLTGGRPAGIMAAAARGAKSVPGSLTVGVLPSERGGEGDDVDLAIYTGMGNARNMINVLTSDAVVACGVTGPGTASEVALALKVGKPVILLGASDEARAFFRKLGEIAECASVEQCVVQLRRMVARAGGGAR